jgi:hypothetical protein
MSIQSRKCATCASFNPSPAPDEPLCWNLIAFDRTDVIASGVCDQHITPAGRRKGFTPLDDTHAEPQRAGFTPLDADNTSTDPNKTSVLRNVLLNNPITAVGEAALNLGSQIVSMPVAGLAGLGTLAGNALGLTDRTGADMVHSVGEALTYQPRGELGQAAAGLVNTPFEKLAEAGQYAGGKTLDATGSPALATAVDSAIQLAPMLIDPAVRAARRAKPAPTAEPVDVVPGTAADAGGGAGAVGQGFTPVESTKQAHYCPVNVVLV